MAGLCAEQHDLPVLVGAGEDHSRISNSCEHLPATRYPCDASIERAVSRSQTSATTRTRPKMTTRNLIPSTSYTHTHTPVSQPIRL